MTESLSERLAAAWDAFLGAILRFLPGLLAAVLILTLGLVVSLLVRVLVRRLLVLARFDRACEAWGLAAALARADIRKPPSALAAASMFWLVFVSFAMAGLSALEVKVVEQLVSSFFLYLPRVLSALLVLVVGFLAANFLSRAVLLSAVNAGVPGPRVVALLVRLLIVVLALAMAMEQLQIARSIVLAAFVLTFGAVMLTLSLAFGLGGREVARKVLERHLAGEKPEEPDEISHL